MNDHHHSTQRAIPVIARFNYIVISAGRQFVPVHHTIPGNAVTNRFENDLSPAVEHLHRSMMIFIEAGYAPGIVPAIAIG